MTKNCGGTAIWRAWLIQEQQLAFLTAGRMCLFGMKPDALPADRLIGIILLFLAAGCDDLRFPRDPDGTLETVLESKEMTVAAVNHPPWVIEDGNELSGAEVALIQNFADELGVSVVWRRVSAFTALEALEQGEVDLAIGGFTQSDLTPHSGAAPTYAYFNSALVVAAPPGAVVPTDLEGLNVLVPPDVMASKLIRDKGGIAVEKSDPGLQADAVAVHHWQLEEHDLVPTGIKLRQSKHVMAVPQGENGWVMELERFLRKSSDQMVKQLREYDQ